MGNLLDAYRRKITYMRISITDRCNLRCQYCMPEGGMKWIEHNDVLRYEEILRIVRIAVGRGLKKVRVTGGEPLIRKGVCDFIVSLRKIKELEDIPMTTNGVFLEENAQKVFEAGIRRLNISMDTLKREKYKDITRGNFFDKVWAGINEAERVGFNPIKINVVLQKGFNDDEINDFVRMTIDRPFHIRFIEFMPVSDWENWRVRYMPMADMKDIIKAEFGELIPQLNTSHGPAVNFKVRGANGVVGFIPAISEHFCGNCNRIRLTADGKMRQCLFSNIYIDFRTPLRMKCEDAELDILLDKVMNTKPEGHHISMESKDKLLYSMSCIGG